MRDSSGGEPNILAAAAVPTPPSISNDAQNLPNDSSCGSTLMAESQSDGADRSKVVAFYDNSTAFVEFRKLVADKAWTCLPSLVSDDSLKAFADRYNFNITQLRQKFNKMNKPKVTLSGDKAQGHSDDGGDNGDTGRSSKKDNINSDNHDDDDESNPRFLERVPSIDAIISHLKNCREMVFLKETTRHLSPHFSLLLDAKMWSKCRDGVVTNLRDCLAKKSSQLTARNRTYLKREREFCLIG